MVKITLSKSKAGYEQYKVTVPNNIVKGFKLDTSKEYDWIIGKDGKPVLEERR